MIIMKTDKKYIFYTSLFTFFLLAYMIAISVADEFGSTYDWPVSHYYPGIARLLGFISFALSRRLMDNERIRRILLIFANIIYLICAMTLIFDQASVPVLLPVLLLSFSAGHLGGLIYYCICAAFTTSDHKGKVIGISCALSILLQFLLTGAATTIIRLVISIVIFLLISYLILRTPSDYILEDMLPYSEESREFRHSVNSQLASIIIIIVICTLLACRSDIAFVSMARKGNVNIYSYPRLAMAAGYLLMGFAADHKDRRAVFSIFFGGVLLSSLLILMPFTDGGYSLLLGIYYFFISIYIFFYTYCFISIAPRTRTPELWACAGRLLSDLLTVIISSVMLAIDVEKLNSSGISYALYYIGLLFLLHIFLSFRRIDPNLTEESGTYKNESDRDLAYSLRDRLNEYSLTPREKDVAYILITTNKPIKAIAADLGISERSVYRFAASIYEKTGTDGRTGLIRKFPAA